MRLLDWRTAVHFDRTGDRLCVLCGKPTPLRSHAREPVHKVCAESWNDTHPEATLRDAYDRDTGTERFHCDPQPKPTTGNSAP
jgi:hypothetical protein